MARRSSIDSLRPYWRLLLIVLPLVIAWPFLVKPSFSLVDDGVSLDMAKRMAANEMHKETLADGTREMPSANWYIEKAHGRVRPVYWWWMRLNYSLWGTSAGGWHLGLVLAIAVLLQLVYEIAYRTTGSVLAGMLAAGLIVCFHPYAPVFSRLGLGETPMLLLLGVSVLCMVWLMKLAPRLSAEEPWGIVALAALCIGALAPLFLAYFTKETCLAMLPASIAMVFVLWRWRSGPVSWAVLLAYAAANAACAVLLLRELWPLLGEGDYAREYFFQKNPYTTAQQLGASLTMLSEYVSTINAAWSALPILALGALGYRLVKAVRGRAGARGAAGGDAGKTRGKKAKAAAKATEGWAPEDVRWGLVWLTFALGSLVLLAPWGGSTLPVPRYLLPFAMFAALLVGREAAWLLTGAWEGLAELTKVPGRFGMPRAVLRAAFVALVGLLCVLAVVNVWLAIGSTAAAHRLQTADANMLRLVAAEAPKGRPLYMKLVLRAQDELRLETQLQLHMIYGRADFAKRSSVKFPIDPADVPDDPAYKHITGLPNTGDWLAIPYGTRFRQQQNIGRFVYTLQPTKLYVVGARGWESVPGDPGVVLDKLKGLKDAWVVMEIGEVRTGPAPAGEASR